MKYKFGKIGQSNLYNNTIYLCIILLAMKSCTENIYKQKINQVIDYINYNLHQPLQLNVIADKVNMSKRQLLRVMALALDEPLYTYVARLRMERSVMYMQTEEIHLQKLTTMVGYDNAQSFSKAFKKQFKISPKAYINKLRLQLNEPIIEDNKFDLSSQICDFEGLDLVYIRICGKYGEEETYKNAWAKLIHFLYSNNLLTSNTRFFGISFDNPNITSNNQCRYYACASIKEKIYPTKDFGTIHLPSGKYAIYTLNGFYSNLGDFHNHIQRNKNYTLRFGIMFDEYLNCLNQVLPDELITKVYIPIK